MWLSNGYFCLNSIILLNLMNLYNSAKFCNSHICDSDAKKKKKILGKTWFHGCISKRSWLGVYIWFIRINLTPSVWNCIDRINRYFKDLQELHYTSFYVDSIRIYLSIGIILLCFSVSDGKKCIISLFYIFNIFLLFSIWVKRWRL